MSTSSKNKERERLSVLHSLNLLDTPREPRFDRIVAYAKQVFGVPIALVSLVDENRQWFKSAVGLDVCETSRDVSFCSISISQQSALIIADATSDPRTSDNLLVVGPPYIRAYAGIPIEVKGAFIGTLCVIDTKPRTFTESEQKTLEALAHWTKCEIERDDLVSLSTELEQNRSRYKALFENSNQAVGLFDLNGTLKEANRQGKLLWTSLGRTATLENFGGDSFRRAFELSGKGETQFVEPFPYSLPTGQILYLQAHLCPFSSSSGEREILVTLDDVSHVMTATSLEQIDELNSKLQQAVESNMRNDAQLALLAHEMRNPLAGILGMCEVILKAPQLFEQNMISDMHSCAKALATLIDDTLDLERLKQGRLVLAEQIFDLSHLVRSIVESHKIKGAQKGIQIETDIPHRLGPVESDPTRLRQILSNLLTNAIKYTETGGSVKVVCRKDENERYLLRVDDTGVGMSEEQLNQVFEPYFQATKSALDSSKGVGLGLTITKRIVDLMGGELGVRSEEGKGSSFWASLPLKTVQRPISVPDAEQLHLDTAVLVVDDNPVNRRILKLQLASTGAHVATASDGLEALETLSRQSFDVVLLDCRMPNLDGYETARKVRAAPGEFGRPYIIALTALAEANTREKCLEAGMDTYLRKPVSFVSLLESIRMWQEAE